MNFKAKSPCKLMRLCWYPIGKPPGWQIIDHCLNDHNPSSFFCRFSITFIVALNQFYLSGQLLYVAKKIYLGKRPKLAVAEGCIVPG